MQFHQKSFQSFDSTKLRERRRRATKPKSLVCSAESSRSARFTLPLRGKIHNSQCHSFVLSLMDTVDFGRIPHPPSCRECLSSGKGNEKRPVQHAVAVAEAPVGIHHSHHGQKDIGAIGFGRAQIAWRQRPAAKTGAKTAAWPRRVRLPQICE